MSCWAIFRWANFVGRKHKSPWSVGIPGSLSGSLRNLDYMNLQQSCYHFLGKSGHGNKNGLHFAVGKLRNHYIYTSK